MMITTKKLNEWCFLSGHQLNKTYFWLPEYMVNRICKYCKVPFLTCTELVEDGYADCFMYVTINKDVQVFAEIRDFKYEFNKDYDITEMLTERERTLIKNYVIEDV
mgnify:CR=1 FL=1